MALTIFWTKRADKKFEKIIGYLQKEWNDLVAQNFVRKVYRFLDVVSEYPQIGTVENKEHKIRGFVVVKQITVFYREAKDKIVILDFFDNRQSPTRKKY